MQPGIHGCSIHPLKSRKNQAEEEKGYPREYTHIHMGVHENI
jgi:hypothetical protein